MKRFSAAVVLFSLFCAGSHQLVNAAEDYYCPPGAKFCPAPGLPGNNYSQSQNQDFGYEYDAPMSMASAPRSGMGVTEHFESQLNEGETLIMVAPNEQNGMYITPNPDAYNDSYSSTSSGFSNSFSPDSYASAPYSSEPYSLDSYSTDTYSAAPMQPVDNYNSYNSGFVPPPPGGGFSPVQDMAYNSQPTQAPMVPEQSGRNFRPKRGEGQPVQERRNVEPSRYDEQADARQNMRRSRGADTIPSREDVAQARGKRKRSDAIVMSEVANQSSRRGGAFDDYDDDFGYKGGDPMMAAPRMQRDSAPPEDRVPWWKGGLWRNRRVDSAEREAAKLEAQARKEQRKAERKRK